MLIVAGLHVPVNPFVDLGGKVGGVLNWHSGAIWAKSGLNFEFTVISFVLTQAHCPAFGLKLYIDVPGVAVLIDAGFHVPVIPFVDDNGSEGGVLPMHSGPISSMVGMILPMIVTSTG